MNYSIGCSGFHYKHWKGDFYPVELPAKKWFTYYCQHFKTLELNVSFYRFPTPAMLETWYKDSPEDFLFSVKAPRSITHFKKLKGTEKMLSDFYNVITVGLQQKLGPVLFQFPPNFVYSSERLKRITDSLNTDFANVVEFRHHSWWTPEVFEELGKHNIAFCGMSHPDFPKDIIHNTRFLYYRMHGESDLYASEYSHQELDKVFSDIDNMDNLKSAYIYFNNDINGYAPRNADYLLKKVK